LIDGGREAGLGLRGFWSNLTTALDTTLYLAYDRHLGGDLMEQEITNSTVIFVSAEE